jgi:hypothetical protein
MAPLLIVMKAMYDKLFSVNVKALFRHAGVHLNGQRVGLNQQAIPKTRHFGCCM